MVNYKVKVDMDVSVGNTTVQNGLEDCGRFACVNCDATAKLIESIE